MRPFFTSRSEWLVAEQMGERACVRQALGLITQSSLLGLLILLVVIGARDPYWRSLPVIVTFVLSLLGALGLSALLFRREWRAALRYYSRPPSSV